MATDKTANNTRTPSTVLTEASEASDATAQPQKRPSDMKKLSCTWPGCDKMFNRQARLDAHLRSHTGEKPFVCHYEGCDKAYTDKKYLNGHIQSAHLKVAKFVCDECGQGFATGQRLERHGDVHIAAERFRCRDYPPCEQTFRKRKTLDRHVLKDHQGKKPFVCEEAFCGQSYATLNALKSHTQREHGEETHFCSPCMDRIQDDPSLVDKIECGFTTKVLLELHIRHEHLNCVFCGDGVPFAGQYELERHIDLNHTEETVKDRKTVPCDWEGCKKKFVKRGNMLQHRRTAHEGVRYECGKVNTNEIPGLEAWDWQTQGCGQLFTSKVGATDHALYMHLGAQRPAYEHQRPGRPKKEYSLLDEISGVTDLERRPIACTVTGCKARFIRYADMDKHILEYHASDAGPSRMGPARHATGFDGQYDDVHNGEMSFLNYGEARSLGHESPAMFGQQAHALTQDIGQHDQSMGQDRQLDGPPDYLSGQQHQSLGQQGPTFVHDDDITAQQGQPVGPRPEVLDRDRTDEDLMLAQLTYLSESIDPSLVPSDIPSVGNVAHMPNLGNTADMNDMFMFDNHDHDSRGKGHNKSDN